MKKSITVSLLVVLAIFLLLIIYVLLLKKENTKQEIEQFSEQKKTEKLSHLLPTGEIDYQYYYGYDYSFGCDYYSKDSLIYHILQGTGQAPVIKEMPMADKETLEILDFLYAKDKKLAYYLGDVLEDADSATFEVIYSDDARGCLAEGGGANFATGFAKDKNNVYQYNKIIDNLDSFSFEYLGNRYIKTKDGIFINDSYNIKQIKEADAKTFKIVQFEDSPSYVNGEYDAMDKNYKYKEGNIID